MRSQHSHPLVISRTLFWMGALYISYKHPVCSRASRALRGIGEVLECLGDDSHQMQV